jgi:glucosyl-dolichyl phosphate glucuronosyltransferase
MKLSVIVCTWNRSERLRKMLKSLQESVIPSRLSWELVLVDNNSDDDTRSVFEEIEKQYGSRIRYVFEEKRGIAHARNSGVMEASGEIVAFTDDDVIIDKYWIQNIEKAFREHEDAACVGGKILPVWEISAPEWLNPNLYHYLALLDYGDSVAYMDSPYIWGANLAVRSEMFKKYGLFDTHLGRIPKKLYAGEETEFLRRLQNGGEKILYYPLSIIYHSVSADRMSKRYLRKWNFDAGELNGILMKDTKYFNLLGLQSLTIRKMVRDLFVALLRIGSFSKYRFNHELRICFLLGFLSGRSKRMAHEIT